MVRQTGPDSLEPVVTDIPYPVRLDFGPDGALYLAYPAFGPDMGQEQGVLLRIDRSQELPISLAGLDTLAPSCTGEAGATPGERRHTSRGVGDRDERADRGLRVHAARGDGASGNHFDVDQ